VDQRESQADRQRRQSRRGAPVRHSMDDEQESEREHQLDDDRRGERVAGRRMLPVAVGGEPVGEAEAGPAGGDRIEHGRGADAADHLGDDVRRHLGPR